MTDEKPNPDEPKKHDYEAKACTCPVCISLKKLGYETTDKWSEFALAPLNDFVTNHLKKICGIVDAKRVDGVLTPDEATELKNIFYVNVQHLTAHLSHSNDQRIGEFVGEAADHWMMTRPRPSILDGLIPMPQSLLEKIMRSSGIPNPFEATPKKEPEPAN